MVKKLSLKRSNSYKYSLYKKRKYFQISKAKKHSKPTNPTSKDSDSIQFPVPLSQQPTQIETTTSYSSIN